MKNDNYLLKPFHVPKIWGGERLSEIFNTSHSDKLGESWVVSRHKDGPSIADGINLDQIVDEKQLPYLVKLLDTSDNLSVQVHPGDEYAAKHENSFGKTECWLILDAAPGAGIYLGLKDGVTKEEFSAALERKDNLDKLLKFYPVKKFDFFFVPAGTIHAIGKNVFLAEIQQSSGITYRVWDWNRLDDKGKSRELHINQALDVISFESKLNDLSHFRHINGDSFQNEKNSLVEFKDFNVDFYQGIENGALETKEQSRYHSILVLEGSLTLKGEEEIELNSFETILLHHNQKMEFQCSLETMFLHIY